MLRHRALILISVLFSLATVAQHNEQPTAREAAGFRGPVKSVHIVSTWQSVNESAHVVSIIDRSFQQDGSIAEINTYDGDGHPQSKLVVGRTRPDGTSMSESSVFVGPAAVRTVTRVGKQHRPVEVANYKLDGTLLNRTVYAYSREGTREIHYDSHGHLVSDVLKHTTQTEIPNGFREQVTTDGKVVSETESVKVGDTYDMTTTLVTAPGKRSIARVIDDGGTRTATVLPDGTAQAYGKDRSGLITTMIVVSRAGKEQRIVQHRDSSHRILSAEVYDGDTILRHELNTYADDPQGNWTKEVNRRFSPSGGLQATITITRTITYY